MNGYVFFYNRQRVEIYADSSYEAQQKAIAYFHPPKSKQHMVHGMLAEKDGKPVIHTPEN
jgi:hypothetical protein